MKHNNDKLLIDYYLETAILTIKEEYALKYGSRALAPDCVEIMQRHPELVSAIFTHLSRTKAKIEVKLVSEMEDKDDLLDD